MANFQGSLQYLHDLSFKNKGYSGQSETGIL